MKVKITADSTSDLSEELIRRYDIAIAPHTVSLGERSGKDGIEITSEDIYAYVDRTGSLPKSSAISMWEDTELVQHWRNEGYEIVHICIGSQFSSAFQNATLAATEVGGAWVVDSKNLSTGQGHVVLYAAELAANGASAAEIVAACDELAGRVEASFVVNTIDYLYKGGRCSALAALGANILQIKPCINVVNGRMVPGKKYTGSIDRVIRSYVNDRLRDRTDIEQGRIFITHTYCEPKTIETVKTLIREYCPDMQEILETTAGATVTSHCGPGTLGVLFIRKPAFKTEEN